MRLFDKVLTQCGKEAPIIVRLCNPAVLCVDQVANYYAMDDRDYWGPEDYPYATPPWKSVFVEWNEPHCWKMEKDAPLYADVLVNDGRYYYRNDRSQCGVLITQYDKATCPSPVLEAMRGHVGPTSAHHVYWVLWFNDSADGTHHPNIIGLWFLDKDGTVVKRAIAGLVANLSNEQRESVERALDSTMHIALLSFTFANCSNVKLDDSTEELQPSPKLRRRLKIPEVKRYTLNIAGHSAGPRRDYEGDPQGIMPFHLCRGHFATYTPDRPMFGNPKLVGRYWHPPHMRGKRENGEVVKDYAISG